MSIWFLQLVTFVHFWVPKNEPAAKRRKGQPITWPSASLCCSKKKGAVKLATFSGSDSPRAIPPFSALLGYVKWHLTTYDYVII